MGLAAVKALARAARAAHRPLHRRRRPFMRGRKGGAFVERHDDVGAERPLHRHRSLRRQQVARSVQMAFEGDAFLAHLRQVRQAHHRSEEHTSELQSLMRTSYAVFCLTKKKMQTYK